MKLSILMVVAAVLVAPGAAAPRSPAAAAAQPASVSMREMPFELTSNKPFVQVRVNGSDPQWFVLDTGCRVGSLIARSCAERLGLRLGDVSDISIGAGQGVKVGFTTTHDVTLGVGGDTLSAPLMGVIPMDHVVRYEGRRLDGLLGEDFMRRHVVEIDYARRRIRLYEPASYVYKGATPPIPITFDGGLVVAQARMAPPGQAPIDAPLVIDTGVRTTVVWYHPFVVEHHLLATQPHVVTGTIGGGAGGETRGDVGRLDSLRIGPFLFTSPTAVFSRDTTGVFAGRDVAGIVGGELLRRFKVTFDYTHQRLMLEPYAGALSDFDYDMSGLFLVSEGPEFKHVTIQSVADRTPAQEAGLRKGDDLVRIDGRLASTLTLDELRDLLKKPGVTYRLEVNRGDQRLEVKLRPRRLT
jgi:hypothetical protein